MATARALRIWPASRKVSCRPALGANPWSSLLAIHVGASGGLKVGRGRPPTGPATRAWSLASDDRFFGWNCAPILARHSAEALRNSPGESARRHKVARPWPIR